MMYSWQRDDLRTFVKWFTDANISHAAYDFRGWHYPGVPFVAPEPLNADGLPVIFGRLSIGRHNLIRSSRHASNLLGNSVREAELAIEVFSPDPHPDYWESVYNQLFTFVATNIPCGYATEPQYFTGPQPSDISQPLFDNFRGVSGTLTYWATNRSYNG